MMEAIFIWFWINVGFMALVAGTGGAVRESWVNGQPVVAVTCGLAAGFWSLAWLGFNLGV